MSWFVLRSNDDWLAYKIAVAEKLGIAADQTNWTDPKEYPCLADSVFIGGRIMTAYVGVNAAQELIDTYNALPGMRESASPQDLNRAFDRGVSADQNACNRALTAHIFTIVHFLTETGICKKGQYEARLAVSQRMVQEAAADAVGLPKLLNDALVDRNLDAS